MAWNKTKTGKPVGLGSDSYNVPIAFRVTTILCRVFHNELLVLAWYLV